MYTNVAVQLLKSRQAATEEEKEIKRGKGDAMGDKKLKYAPVLAFEHNTDVPGI